MNPRLVAEDLAYLESPRWHDGRLWFAHWGREEVLTVDGNGSVSVAAPGRPDMGWSIDWLPDGRMLVTGETLLRQEADGSFSVHADLTGITGPAGVSNEIVVDGRGNTYVNSIEFDFLAGGDPSTGVIAVVTPDGARRVAEELAFPNGMAITPDNGVLVVAESFGARLTAFDIEADGGLTNRRVWADVDGAPDGICLDAAGAIWYADVPNQRCVRVLEGGEVTDVIGLDRGCFACCLGGDDRQTLFMLAAVWDGTGEVESQLEQGTGRIYAVGVDVAGAGYP